MRVTTMNLLNRFWKNGIIPIKEALDKKFDSTKLANNLLTTEEGFGLDARQGTELKRLIDEQNSNLSDLNSSLKNLFVTRTITKSITVQYLQQMSIPITVISGYTPVAISGQQIDYRIKTYGASIVQSNISVPASSADGTQVTANVTFYVLYIKS